MSVVAGPHPVPEPDFRALFESAPGLFLVLNPDFTIVAVSDDYLKATMTRRDELLGRTILEVSAENSNDSHDGGVRHLRASLQQVLADRKPHRMTVQKYEIRRPESEGGGVEERYWSPMNLPVLDRAGNLINI